MNKQYIILFPGIKLINSANHTYLYNIELEKQHTFSIKHSAKLNQMINEGFSKVDDLESDIAKYIEKNNLGMIGEKPETFEDNSYIFKNQKMLYKKRIETLVIDLTSSNEKRIEGCYFVGTNTKRSRLRLEEILKSIDIYVSNLVLITNNLYDASQLDVTLFCENFYVVFDIEQIDINNLNSTVAEELINYCCQIKTSNVRKLLDVEQDIKNKLLFQLIVDDETDFKPYIDCSKICKFLYDIEIYQNKRNNFDLNLDKVFQNQNVNPCLYGKLYIDSNKNIKICKQGNVIKKLYSSLSNELLDIDVSASFNHILNNEKCRTCNVKEVCSGCTLLNERCRNEFR